METKDKILIVEDDETIAAFLIAVLEANGFDTIRASLGREAVTLISSHCPDLVLLDLSLPDMDGMEILAGAPQVVHAAGDRRIRPRTRAG